MVAGYYTSAALHNVSGVGQRGRGVALLVRHGVTCLGMEYNPDFVAVAITGDFGMCVVCSVYVPPV